MEGSGFVDAVLKVASGARDTDFAVKLVDVAPDGTAWIIGDTMLRARCRDSYTQPGLMQAGQVYTLKPTPITTSIRFDKGHRIRAEVTNSNFPKFPRNLTTGCPHETASQAVVADTHVQPSAHAASYTEMPA